MPLFTDYINGGELFTHLYQREKFTENEVRIYIGEIVLALEHLHKVRWTTNRKRRSLSKVSAASDWLNPDFILKTL